MTCTVLIFLPLHIPIEMFYQLVKHLVLFIVIARSCRCDRRVSELSVCGEGRRHLDVDTDLCITVDHFGHPTEIRSE